MWLMTDQIKSKQCHFDVPRFSASLMLKFLEFVFLFKATFIFRQTVKKRGKKKEEKERIDVLKKLWLV